MRVVLIGGLPSEGYRGKQGAQDDKGYGDEESRASGSRWSAPCVCTVCFFGSWDMDEGLPIRGVTVRRLMMMDCAHQGAGGQLRAGYLCAGPAETNVLHTARRRSRACGPR